MTDYRADIVAWSREQADALQRRSTNELDWENIAEEIDGLGRQQQWELYNRLVVLLAHLLKWEFQPHRNSRSWSKTILNERFDIARQLKLTPSLKAVLADEFAEAYPRARSQASLETRLPPMTFPAEPPFTLEQALDVRWTRGGEAQSSVGSNGS